MLSPIYLICTYLRSEHADIYGSRLLLLFFIFYFFAIIIIIFTLIFNFLTRLVAECAFGLYFSLEVFSQNMLFRGFLKVFSGKKPI
jgi:hypothetical protein